MNRLERAPGDAYHKIGCDREALQDVFVDVFLDAHRKAPRERSCSISTPPTIRCTATRGRFFHGDYDCYCYLLLYVFCGLQVLAANCGARISTPRPTPRTRWRASSPASDSARQGTNSAPRRLRLPPRS